MKNKTQNTSLRKKPTMSFFFIRLILILNLIGLCIGIYEIALYSGGKQEFAFWNEGKSNSAGLTESTYELEYFD